MAINVRRATLGPCQEGLQHIDIGVCDDGSRVPFEYHAAHFQQDVIRLSLMVWSGILHFDLLILATNCTAA